MARNYCTHNGSDNCSIQSTDNSSTSMSNSSCYNTSNNSLATKYLCMDSFRNSMGIDSPRNYTDCSNSDYNSGCSTDSEYTAASLGRRLFALVWWSCMFGLK